METVRIFGRRSSHFTRLVRLFAEECGVACELTPIYDMSSLDPADYGGHPGLKLPVLEVAGETVLGAENICRLLAERGPNRPRVVWPEDLPQIVARNAQELVWHGMSAQVQLAFGVQVMKLPADNAYFAKAAAGLSGALAWLEREAPALIAALPSRDLSLFEASLFCLIEHIVFRPTVPLEPYGRLVGFARAFAERAAARATAYAFDRRPA